MILIGIVLAGLAVVCIWLAATRLGAGLTDRWAGRGRRREARRLGAYMTDTHMAGMELSKADLAGAELSRANLKGANAAEASLEGATVVDANLTGANLRGANLSRSNLKGSVLSRANLLRARLRDANLERANLRSAYLYGTDLEAALLREANLEEADLRYANLAGANLQGASLRGADVDDTTVMPQGWELIVASKPEDEQPSHRADEEGSSVTGAQDTALRGVMKLCLNCQTENPADAGLCSSCGMDLARARGRDEAQPVDTTVKEGIDGLQIAKFMWGWLLLGVGVPSMLCSALMNACVALTGMLDSGFGAWMVWSVARRRGVGDPRIRALMWAGGPLAGGTIAMAWLIVASLALLVTSACPGGGAEYCALVSATLYFQALGSLFVAPLVGAIIVLVEWLRHRSKSSEILPGSE
ncbi:MAG TPA: pentapeptide repeat-containing protein [Anaerolineae bacterium]|nr:pentapeptide repeat-containing protein [Anaerolineae bacterium]